ncbi:unnamed protein product, partial [Laminaria digitata]
HGVQKGLPCRGCEESYFGNVGNGCRVRRRRYRGITACEPYAFPLRRRSRKREPPPLFPYQLLVIFALGSRVIAILDGDGGDGIPGNGSRWREGTRRN